MGVFEDNYGLIAGTGENKVACPFHDDQHPSAYVNMTKRVFYCPVCGEGYSERMFAKKLYGKTTIPVVPQQLMVWHQRLWATKEALGAIEDLGITQATVLDKKLGLDTLNGVPALVFPYTEDGVYAGRVLYNYTHHKGIPKYVNEGVRKGIIFGVFDPDEPVLICEGEKDACVAYSKGLNAICLSGGASATPTRMTIDALQDCTVEVCYDTDRAGQEGMHKTAQTLADNDIATSTIDISPYVSVEKGDLADYFTECDLSHFSGVLRHETQKRQLEPISILSSVQTSSFGVLREADVIVVGEYANTYYVPTKVEVTKVEEPIKKTDKMDLGETRVWELGDRYHQLLPLFEVGATNPKLNQCLLAYCGVSGESGVRIDILERATIFHSLVTDIECISSPFSMEAYSFERMEVGGKYKVVYTLYAHTNKSQKVVGFLPTVYPHAKITDKVNKEALRIFKPEDTLRDRIDKLYGSARAYIAKHLNYNIWLVQDLVFNSILEFDYITRMRGALDVFILGSTQVGKSETASALVKMYNFGHFLSLKTSTTLGLIGGTQKNEGGYLLTLGAIPREHRKLVVMEEFSGADPAFINTMTDIRSSGEVRIVRVSGEVTAPCRLRMITISNPVNDEQGKPQDVESYPDGVTPILELVKASEDVARYDGFLLVPKPKERINPFDTEVLTPEIPPEYYIEKAHWVESRKPEDVVFDKGVESYIFEEANKLNEQFECNVPIFGTTTHLKLARWCVACASLTLSTDEDFEKVVVTKEIVDFVVATLCSIYTSPWFRLNETKEAWQDFEVATQSDIDELQQMYASNVTLLDYLCSVSKTTRNNLESVSGLDRSAFNSLFQTLVQMHFVTTNVYYVYPTGKLRKAYREIDRSVLRTAKRKKVEVIG